MKTKPQQITSFIADFPHWLAVVFLVSFAFSAAGMLLGASGFLGVLLVLGGAGMTMAYGLNFVLSKRRKVQG